jgi:hypothetical protein
MSGSEGTFSEVSKSVAGSIPTRKCIKRFSWVGGLSFLSSQYGWGANNVVNYEIVLANSTVVNANANSNSGRWDPRPPPDFTVC